MKLFIFILLCLVTTKVWSENFDVTLVPIQNSQDIINIMETLKKDELYKSDVNIKNDYLALKKYDADNNTDYAKMAMLLYLEKFLKNSPRPLHLHHDFMYRDFRSFISQNFSKMPSSTVEATLLTAKLLIDSFQERANSTDALEEGTLRSEIYNISRAALEISAHSSNPFYHRYFSNKKSEQFSPGYKVAAEQAFKRIQEREKLQQVDQTNNKNRQQVNTLKNHILDFVKSHDKYNETKAQFVFQEGIIEVEYIKHYAVENTDNVIMFPTNRSFNRIYTIRVISPTPQSRETVLHATQALLEIPGVYGVYFDTKLRIPSGIDFNKYQISRFGKTRVLIRQASLACSRLFL